MRNKLHINNETSEGVKTPGNISFLKTKSPTGWTTSIFVSGTIAEEFYSAEWFQRELEWADQDPNIEDICLILNSRGGDLVQASAMYDTLVACKKTVTAKIYGVCGSAATLLPCAADKVYIAPNASFFIHMPSGKVEGGSDAMESYIAEMKRYEEMLLGIYSERTGMSREDILAAMKLSTVYSAEEAVKSGWVDGLIKEEEGVADPIAAHAPDSPSAEAAPEDVPNQTDNTALKSGETEKKESFWKMISDFFSSPPSASASAPVNVEPVETSTPPEETPTDSSENWKAKYEALEAEVEGKKAFYAAKEAAFNAQQESFQARVQEAAVAQVASLGHAPSDLPPAETGDTSNRPMTSEAEKFEQFKAASPENKSSVFRDLYGDHFPNMRKY